jgi:hypothetical protein
MTLKYVKADLRFCFLPFVAFFVNAASANTKLCSSYLIRAAVPHGEAGLLREEDAAPLRQLVEVNEILVTGEDDHSTEQVLANLGITDEIIKQWVSEHKFVISVGEGMSGLIPFLVSKGVNAIGIDLWYDDPLNIPDNDTGRKMRAYITRNHMFLKSGDVRALPFDNSSVDVVLTHKLFNNMYFSDVLQGHREIMRVLRSSGECYEHNSNTDPHTVAAFEIFKTENLDKVEFRPGSYLWSYFRKNKCSLGS